MKQEPVSWQVLLHKTMEIDCFPSDAVEPLKARDELHERLTALEAWAKARIRGCDEEIAQHDGTLRVDGKVVGTYPAEGIMGRVDQGVRIRAGAEKQALEVVLRMLDGHLEAE